MVEALDITIDRVLTEVLGKWKA